MEMIFILPLTFVIAQALIFLCCLAYDMVSCWYKIRKCPNCGGPQDGTIWAAEHIHICSKCGTNWA